ncbi:hypothetical protein H0H92_015465 [Tricholoma furcatifolium]|nr:hypothetical protein H0H92_015465 [Tricholoma furcatifolium]
MLAIFARFRKSTATVKSYPAHWFDPSAVPAAPILVRGATGDNQKKQVHWWGKDTIAVTASLSPPMSQEEFKVSTPTGFNSDNGLSYLGDFSGDISWDTIKDSAEDDGDFSDSDYPVSPLACDSPDTPALFDEEDDSSSNYSSDSNLSMAVTDEDNTETFYFAAPQVFEGTEIVFVPGEYQVAEPLFEEESESKELVVDVSEECYVEIKDVRMGEGRALRRTSTITGLVGEEIRKRRARFQVFVDEDCAEPLRQARLVKRSRRGGPKSGTYMPHILTPILEDADEE